MQKLAFLAFFCTAISAQAHFNIGTYKGMDDFGSDCEIEFVKKSFANNIQNPLNEIVDVKINQVEDFALRHPLELDIQKGSATYAHNLTGHMGTLKGARAVRVLMNDSVGPFQFVMVEDNWKEDKQELYTCGNLKFISK